MKKNRCEPLLSHSAGAVSLYVPLTIPYSGEHAFNGIGRGKGFSDKDRYVQSVKGKDSFDGLHERIGC